MRELTIRLRFVTACLGNVRKYHRQRGNDRAQHYFVLPRHPVTGRVMFSSKWWSATLHRAAEIMCKHQQVVQEIRFAPELDGIPRPIPDQFYRRHFKRKFYTKHEAFFPGDIVSVTAAVPEAINDDDFLRLMRYAGKYCGISPAHHEEFGTYDVLTVRRASLLPEPESAVEGNGYVVETKKAIERCDTSDGQ